MSTCIGFARRAVFSLVATALVLAVAPRSARGQFVEYNEQSGARISALHNLVLGDTQEKDYAWGDLDQDGDIDLVIVRKEPFSTTGKRTNVLLMNEAGVLTDRTTEYATASDVGGDQGFKTATNDRDVILVDVDGDDWLDMVTAVTLSDNNPKHISHPRVYRNLGEDEGGNWLGFEYQDARIPQMHATAGPRFCSVAAGDVTGDGYPDLYFGDYDNCTDCPSMIFDFDNRLLINDGNGYFTDESADRMNSQMLESAFGAASAIADMNNDGFMDVVKQTSLNAPTHVAITYNDSDNIGYFDFYDVIRDGSPYFFSVGYLNGDNVLDIVIVDDGTDLFMIGQGTDNGDHRDFLNTTFPNSGGFGGNSVIADLDNNGDNDVIITDVDVDAPGCSRFTHLYENLGDNNQDMPSFAEEQSAIPGSSRTGWHDAAVFDINGDGWLDIVAGRCTGTDVWIGVPPFNIAFEYPNALPEFVPPNEAYLVQIELNPIGASVDTDSVRLHYSVNGGGFVEVPMMPPFGGDIFQAALPAVECLDVIDFYFEAQLDNGFAFQDPAGAPADTYDTFAALGTAITFSDDMEADVSAWTVESDEALVAGEWEPADPNGTVWGGDLAAPDNDATAGGGNVMAFVTQNCTGSGCDNAANSDVDGGPTYLISPMIDLSGTDATIRYARWFFTSSQSGEDSLMTEVSDDGGDSWTAVHSTQTTNGNWEIAEFTVSDFVSPSAETRVRFIVVDAFEAPTASIVEAGIDDFEVEHVVCTFGPCAQDLNDDGFVDAADLALLLGGWGACGDCGNCPADLNGDCSISAGDLAELLGAWGACS